MLNPHRRFKILYAVRMHDLVKVGVTQDIKTLYKRLYGMQAACGRYIDELLTIADSDVQEEARILEQFSEWRCVGEWLRATSEIVDYLRWRNEYAEEDLAWFQQALIENEPPKATEDKFFDHFLAGRHGGLPCARRRRVVA